MGSEARARLALAGVLGVAFLSFAQVFAEGPYAGPALMAMIVAGAIALGARRLGAPTATTLLLSIAALTWYVALIFQARHTFYGLPTWSAIEGLGRAVARAYHHSQVDYAPVPVRSGYVIMVIVGLWIAATGGELATFRWRRPLAAMIAPTALLCVALVFGTGTATPLVVLLYLSALLSYLALESADRLGSWGRWVTTFGSAARHFGAGSVGLGGRAAPTGSVFARVARRMTMSCLASIVVVPLVLPSLGSGLIAWRSGVGDGNGPGRGGPGGGSGRIDPLVSLAPALISQTDDTLFTVEADEAAYWRLVSLTIFDGQSWRPDSESRLLAPGGALQVIILDPTKRRFVSQRFSLSGLGGLYLPAAATPETVGLPPEHLERLRYHRETFDLALEGGLAGVGEYTVESSVPDLSYGNLLKAEIGDPGARYRALPVDLSPEVGALATEWTSSGETPGEKLVALQAHLRRFEYRLPTPDQVAAEAGRASADYLVRFLTEVRAGYCQQFSTAFALLARTLGYPTRVSVGFLPGQADISGGVYTVRGTDAHAWPEVYFKGYGWVPFEPTPRSAAAVPDHTLSPLAAAANFQRSDAEFFGVFDPRGGLDVRTLTDPGLAGVANARGRATRQRSEGTPGALGYWVRAFNRLAGAAGIVLVVLLAGIPSLRAARARRRYARARTPRASAAAAFANVQERASVLGSARADSESAAAYVRKLAAQRDLPLPPFSRLAAIHEAAEYSPEGPGGVGPPEAAEARDLARRLTRALWDAASWWERAVGLFSPRGLVPERLARRP